MKTKKNIIIFSTRIARDLIQKGFVINDIQPNIKNKDRTVFYFSNTKEIREYLKEKHNIYIE